MNPIGEHGAFTIAAGRTVSTFAATALPDGLAVAWVERGGESPPAVRLQRFASATGTFSPLPEAAGADGDTSISLAAGADGTLALAMTYNAGLRPVLQLSPGATSWVPLGAPDVQSPRETPLVLVTPDGVALAWVSDFVSLAIHRGGAWESVARGVGRRPNIQMDLRAASPPGGGPLYLLWRDSDSATSEGSRMFAARFERNPRP